jgi:cystathionine beta-lyase/cystathionine gamma-synthase
LYNDFDLYLDFPERFKYCKDKAKKNIDNLYNDYCSNVLMDHYDIEELIKQSKELLKPYFSVN